MLIGESVNSAENTTLLRICIYTLTAKVLIIENVRINIKESIEEDGFKLNRLEIRTEIENLVQDSSFTTTVLNDYINQAILYVGANTDIPELKGIGVVTTVLSQAYTTLSGLTGGFSGKLRRVKDADGNAISIYSDLALLMDAYPTMNEEGEVEAVALEGSTLWYQDIPVEEETLTCLYYRNPAILSSDTESPSDFPTHLHRQLFVHGSAWIIYDQIEDGIDGEKVNTKGQFWHSFDERNRHSGIVKLKEWIAKTRRHSISSSWRE